MTRPPLEVADLVRTAGTAFIERNRHWLRWAHIKGPTQQNVAGLRMRMVSA